MAAHCPIAVGCWQEFFVASTNTSRPRRGGGPGRGELSDEELYPGDAQWAGLYDRMLEREEDETVRRFQIAADNGAPADA